MKFRNGRGIDQACFWAQVRTGVETRPQAQVLQLDLSFTQDLHGEEMRRPQKAKHKITICATLLLGIYPKELQIFKQKFALRSSFSAIHNHQKVEITQTYINR